MCSYLFLHVYGKNTQVAMWLDVNYNHNRQCMIVISQILWYVVYHEKFYVTSNLRKPKNSNVSLWSYAYRQLREIVICVLHSYTTAIFNNTFSWLTACKITWFISFHTYC